MSMTFDEFKKQQAGAANRLLDQLEKILFVNAKRAESRSMGVAFSRYRNQTGNLRGSTFGGYAIENGIPRMFLQAGGYNGGGIVDYAADIEFGTKKGIRARLFLGRSFAIQRDEIDKELRPLLKLILRTK
jgi:hypothetical protein